MGRLDERVVGGVTGLALSLAVPLLLYPYLLRVTIGAWFALHPDAFEGEEDEPIAPHS